MASVLCCVVCCVVPRQARYGLMISDRVASVGLGLHGRAPVWVFGGLVLLTPAQH